VASSFKTKPTKETQVLADSYPFWSLMGTMLVFFVWILFFWLLFGVFADIFSRHDLSGWGKTGWVIFVVILPFLGIFIYLISQSDGMRERSLARQGPQPAYQGGGTSGGAAAEIESGKKLLDSGAISQAEFDALKQKALG
jgi:hypothetical protein